jgi:hypothetical protein
MPIEFIKQKTSPKPGTPYGPTTPSVRSTYPRYTNLRKLEYVSFHPANGRQIIGVGIYERPMNVLGEK